MKLGFLFAPLMAVIISIISPQLAFAEASPSAKDAKVYFINIKDGDVISGPVHLKFGLSGMGIAPAGTKVKNTGHFHLIINDKIEGPELKNGIPSDENHIHFGGGQTETTLNLKPGTYKLQLILGDFKHTPHTPPVMTEQISITVK